MMIRKLIPVFFIIFIPVLLVLVALLASPSLRFAMFRMITELPALVTHFTIQKYVKSHNFAASAAGLERQLSVIQMAGVRRNSMIRGMINNTEMVMGVADLAEDYAAMRPFLDRFVADQPQLFIARIWLAKALSYTDPALAFPHLEEAARLVQADDRSYRIAVRTALAIGDEAKARDWCKRYAAAKFGGIRPLIYRNIFAGTGLRKMALEIPGGKGIPVRLLNEGIVIGTTQTYDFDLPERTTVETLRLHLGLMPGIKVTLQNMTLYGPDGIQRLAVKDLIILPEEGFVLGNGELLTVSPDGEVLTLRKRKGVFGSMDRVDLRMTFERAGLATLPGCEGS